MKNMKNSNLRLLLESLPIVKILSKPKNPGVFPWFLFFSFVSFLDSAVRSRVFRFLRECSSYKKTKKRKTKEKKGNQETRIVGLDQIFTILPTSFSFSSSS